MPTRPEHPDMDRLAASVTLADDLAQAYGDISPSLAAHVDPASAEYMAFQRALRVCLIPPADHSDMTVARSATAWLDGFMAGLTYAGQPPAQGTDAPSKPI